jgi:hypothetical protein
MIKDKVILNCLHEYRFVFFLLNSETKSLLNI